MEVDNCLTRGLLRFDAIQIKPLILILIQRDAEFLTGIDLIVGRDRPKHRAARALHG